MRTRWRGSSPAPLRPSTAWVKRQAPKSRSGSQSQGPTGPAQYRDATAATGSGQAASAAPVRSGTHPRRWPRPGRRGPSAAPAPRSSTASGSARRRRS
ncbi:hypothetical protein G6F66_014817 [Rhizopus arrhizus]|nr:hypothetical protein G6F66_014817 [Rhizopus arrhizus]